MLTSSDFRVLTARGRLRPPAWASPNELVRAEFPPRFRAWVSDMAEYEDFPSFVAAGHADFARASAKRAEDLAGVYSQFGAGELARTNKGALIEPAAVNLIPNTDMSGAVPGVIGAGGSLPTGWRAVMSGGDPFTVEVTDIGVEDGLPYVEVRVQYVSGSNFRIEITDAIAGVEADEDWVMSAFFKKVAGTWPSENTAAFMHVQEMGDDGNTFPGLPRSADMEAITRLDAVWTTTRTGDITLRMRYPQFSGAEENVDVTFRIGPPNLIKAAELSSPIVGSGTAVTRAADALTLNLPASAQNVTLIFDDDSQQVLPAAGGAYQIDPAAIDRPWIKSIVAEDA